MIGFSCGIGNSKDRNKSCMQCKHFFMFGIGSGYCCVKINKNDEDDMISPQGHCKYYKRNVELFYSDGRIKDQDLFDEMMYI